MKSRAFLKRFNYLNRTILPASCHEDFQNLEGYGFEVRSVVWREHLYAPKAPVVLKSAADILQSNDVVVFPEVKLVEYFFISTGWNCRKAVYIQNGFYALRQCPRGGDSRHGVEFVITIAPYINALGARPRIKK